MKMPVTYRGGATKRNRRFFIYLIALLAVAFGIFVICARGNDPDFGWHLRSGQQILESGIPANDIYSFTMPNFAWVNHEWLNDVISWKVYELGGTFLLALMFTFLWLGGLVVASRRLDWRLIMVGFIGLVPYLGIRPVAWTFLFIALLEVIIDKYRTSQKSGSLLVIIGLLAIWANIHAGFAFGLVILWLHGIYSRDRRLLIAGVLSVVATLCNPYGWRVYEEIARTMFDSELKSRVTEWHHLFSDPTTGLRTVAPAVFIFIGVIFLASRFTIKPIRQIFSIPTLTFIMALQTNRQMVLFIVTSLRYIGEGIRYFEYGFGKRWRVVTSLIFLVPFGYVYLRMVVPKVIKKDDDFSTLALIVNRNCTGNIFNYYDVGGALIQHGRDLKLYIDGRMPSWVDNEGNIFERYLKVVRNSNYRKLEFNRYAISCVVLPDRGEAVSAMARDLYAEKWQFAGSSGGYVVIKNVAAPPLEK